MQLGIVVLSFNHPDLTARAVKSILDQVRAESVHLVHNGSRADVVHRLREQFGQVNHHVLAQNLGYTGGVNFSLEAVFEKFEWAFLVTNDCELLSLGEVPKTPALSAPLIWLRRTNRVNSLGGRVDFSLARLEHCLTAEDWSLARQRYVPGTAFLLHRDVYRSVGPFDESLHTYWEDVDFSVRAEKCGWPLTLAPDFQLRHGVGKTCHKDPFYTRYLYQRNRRQISRRHVQGARNRLRLEIHLVCDRGARGLRAFNKTAVKALNNVRPLFFRN